MYCSHCSSLFLWWIRLLSISIFVRSWTTTNQLKYGRSLVRMMSAVPTNKEIPYSLEDLLLPENHAEVRVKSPRYDPSKDGSFGEAKFPRVKRGSFERDAAKKSKYSPTKVRLRTSNVNSTRSSASLNQVSAQAKELLLLVGNGKIEEMLQLLSATKSWALYAVLLKEFNLLITELCDKGYIEPCGAVLDDMRRRGIKPTRISYTIIVSRAGAWQKVNLAEAYFARMIADGIKADAQAYNSLISVYAKSGDVDKASRILVQMDQEDVAPTVVTFNTLIESCARMGKVHAAQEMLLMMKTRGLHPDERSFSAVVQACCQAGEVDAAFNLVQKMDFDGIKPAAITYSSLLHGLGKTGDLERAYQVLDLMKAGGINPNVVTMSSLVYACGRHDKLDLAIKIYREMLRSVNEEDRPNSITCSTLVDACLKAGKVAKAFAVVKDMRSHQIPLTEVTYTSLITELTRLKKLDMLLGGIMGEPPTRGKKQYEQQGQGQSDLLTTAETDLLPRNSSSGSRGDVFPGSSKTISADEEMTTTKSKAAGDSRAVAGPTLKMMRQTAPHLNAGIAFNAVQTAAAATGSVKSPAIAAGGLKSSGVEEASLGGQYFDPSAPVESALETAAELMQTFREGCNHQAVVSVYEALKTRYGTTPSARMYKILLSSLDEDSKRRAEESDKLSVGGTEGSTTNDSNNSDNNNIATTAAMDRSEQERKKKQAPASASASHRQQSLLTSSRPSFLAPTTSVAAATSYPSPLPNTDGHSQQGPWVSKNLDQEGSGVKIPGKRLRHDELFRLYLVFQEMRIAGVQADAATYNTLINACASVGDLEKALETVETMQLEGIEPDVVTYTSLLKACGINAGHGTVLLAEEIFAQMQQRTNHFSNYVEPTELTFQRLMQVHLNAGSQDYLRNKGWVNRSNGHMVDTKRIWELLEDMLKRGLKPGISSFRSCVKAALLDCDVEKGRALLIMIRGQTRVGFDYMCWDLIANIFAMHGLEEDESDLRREIEYMRNREIAMQFERYS